MTDLIRTVLTGAIAGGVYSLIGVGLVVTYSVTGIFDLGYGGIAFSAALLFYELNSGLGWNRFVAAGFVVLVICPLLGLALNALIYRPLARTSSTVKLVTSVGVLVGLPALVKFVIEQGIEQLDWGIPLADNVSATPGVWFQPAENWTLPYDGIVVNSNQVTVLVLGALVSVGLWALFRSRLGLAMRAVRDRRDLAALRGVSERRTSRAAAVIGSSLAGLAGVAGAPILSSLNTGTFTVALLVASAAVVIGRFRSVPWTFAGGLLLGIAVNLIFRYVEIEELPEINQAAPFIVLLVGLLLLGRSRDRVAGFVSEEQPAPDWRADLTLGQRARVPLIASAVFLYLAYFHFSDYWAALTLRSLALAVVLLSLTVITGLGGLVSLAQATFASTAALTTGLLVNQYEWTLFAAGVVGVLAATVLGVVVALPSLRLGGVPFALATLALALMGQTLLLGSDYMTNNGFGWLVERPLLGPLDLGEDRTFLLVVAVVVVALVIGIGNLRRSATGRAMLAVRSTEAAASSIGLSAPIARLRLLALSSALAGLGGVLLVIVDQGASDQTTPPLAALTWLTVVVVLGVGRPGAAVIGGFGLVLWPALIDSGFTLPFDTISWGGITTTQLAPMLFGLAAIDIARNPDGAMERISRTLYLRRQRRATPAEAPTPAGAELVVNADEPSVGPTAAPVADPAVSVRHLHVGYGLVEVLHGVSFDVPKGAITVLLGANGAGKSTACRALAGAVDAAAGAVELDGVAVPEGAKARADAGILLVPEGRGVFPGLSVEDNLRLALPAAADRDRAYERFPILRDRRTLLAGSLSGGEQQMLSLAVVLAHPPVLAIVDEPTLGLAPRVTAEVLAVLKELCGAGSTVLLAEEKRHTIEAVADHVVLLALGRTLWQGPPTEIPEDLLDAAYGLHTELAEAFEAGAAADDALARQP